MTRFIICIIGMCILASTPQAREVNVCVSIALPAKGKCIYKTVRGYKVRICNP